MEPKTLLSPQGKYFSRPCLFQKIQTCLTLIGLLAIVAFFVNTWISVKITKKPVIFGTDLNEMSTIPKHLNNTRAMKLFNLTQKVEISRERGEKSKHGLTHGQPPSRTKPKLPKIKCTDDFKNRHFMTTGFPGRTGNIFFVLAAVIAIAKQTCYTAVIQNGTVPGLDDIFDMQNVKRLSLNTSSFNRVFEPGWGKYDENITLKINPEFNWTIGGYRQSYLYFSDHIGLIKSSFRFKRKICNDVNNYLNNGTVHGYLVGMHVRRGDRIWRKNGVRASELEYMNRSIAYMKDYLEPYKFTLLVVSDDIAWCKKNIRGDNVIYSPFKDIGRDLYLLTQCDHLIITTGTFSLAAAWLNEPGVVVYDKLFPLPNTSIARGYRVDDYYPRHWVGL